MNTISSVLDVTNFGVVGDGTTNNTKKIAEVIGELKSWAEEQYIFRRENMLPVR